MTRALASLAVIAALLAFPEFAGAIPSGSLTVTTTTDETTSPGTGCSLREAIMDANAPSGNPYPECGIPVNGGHNTITMPTGTFAISSALQTAGEDNNATGDFDIKADVEIDGAGQSSTTISGAGHDRVFDVITGPVTLKNLTISGGHAPDGTDGGPGTTGADGGTGQAGEPSLGGSGTVGEPGGGIRMADHLTLDQVTVQNNTAGSGGKGGNGGAGGKGGNDTPTAKDGGASTGGPGGDGGAGGGIADVQSPPGCACGPGLTIHNSTFTGNHAGAGGVGGAAGTGGAGGGDGSETQGGAGGQSNGGVGGVGGNGGAIDATSGWVVLIDNSNVNGDFAGAGGVAGAAGTGGAGGAGSTAGGAGGDTNGGHGGAGGAGGGGGAIAHGSYLLAITDTSIATNEAGAGAVGGDGGHAGAGAVNGLGGAATGGAGGSGGAGGAILAVGAQSALMRTTLNDNQAGAGGAGGEGGTGGAGLDSPGFNVTSAGGYGGKGGAGGGLAQVGDQEPIVNSTITGNRAGAGGAGGPGGTGPEADFQGAGGDGGSGGGVFLSNLNTTAAALTHATINGNLTGSGGAAGASGTSPSHQIRLPGAGGAGGGVLVDGSGGNNATLTNSIVASNSAPNCALTNSGAVADGGHNVVFSTQPGDTSCPAASRGNPLLQALANYGGPTKTERIGQASPARDIVPVTSGVCDESSDQRSVFRPLGPACDAGAYELGVPLVVTGGSSGVTLTAATVKGSVNANTFVTTYRFEYGKTNSYGSTTASAQLLGGAPVAQQVSAKLTKLQPNTLYHYRLVATNSEGTVRGSDHTLKTGFPGVKLPTGKAKLDSKGRVPIKVTCPKGSVGSCFGKLTLKAKLGKKTKAIGSSGFKNVGAGKTKILKIKLSDAARLALAANGKLTATEIAQAQDGRHGPRQTTSRSVTLKPA